MIISCLLEESIPVPSNLFIMILSRYLSYKPTTGIHTPLSRCGGESWRSSRRLDSPFNLETQVRYRYQSIATLEFRITYRCIRIGPLVYASCISVPFHPVRIIKGTFYPLHISCSLFYPRYYFNTNFRNRIFILIIFSDFSCIANIVYPK